MQICNKTQHCQPLGSSISKAKLHHTNRARTMDIIHNCVNKANFYSSKYKYRLVIHKQALSSKPNPHRLTEFGHKPIWPPIVCSSNPQINKIVVPTRSHYCKSREYIENAYLRCRGRSRLRKRARWSWLRFKNWLAKFCKGRREGKILRWEERIIGIFLMKLGLK